MAEAVTAGVVAAVVAAVAVVVEVVPVPGLQTVAVGKTVAAAVVPDLPVDQSRAVGSGQRTAAEDMAAVVAAAAVVAVVIVPSDLPIAEEVVAVAQDSVPVAVIVMVVMRADFESFD